MLRVLTGFFSMHFPNMLGEMIFAHETLTRAATSGLVAQELSLLQVFGTLMTFQVMFAAKAMITWRAAEWTVVPVYMSSKMECQLNGAHSPALLESFGLTPTLPYE